ncbi:hypothetical protein ACWDSJ_28325 [Nocardia sp. NPDC003482]
MNQPVSETPVMGIPREDTMRMALAARTLASVLRQLREQRGRSAWDDAENVARKNAVLSRHAVAKFSRADAEEWNTAEKEGRIHAERHPDTGMTIRVAPLSRGRVGVQAGWEDHHAEAVVGSEDLADRVTEWLRANPTAEAVDDLRRNADDLHDDALRRRRHTQDRRHEARLAAAQRWLEETDPDRFAAWQRAAAAPAAGNRPSEEELITEWAQATGGDFPAALEWVRAHRPEWYDDWSLRYAYADSVSARRSDEATLIDYWRRERRAEPTEPTQSRAESDDHHATRPLADRLRGRVPDRVLDDPRWREVAENQFAALVAQGADPDMLIGAVAAIDFNNGRIRAPSGFAAWAMREAAKKGHAADAHTRSEEDARRSVAEEWLTTADPDDPFDRARAAHLVGEIDDDFDALLARKYPGLLDGDADHARAHAAQHTAAAGVADAQARTEETTAPTPEAEVDDAVFVVDRDGSVITVPFTAAPQPQAEADAEAADHRADAARDHGAADDEHQQATRTAAAAAQAPLTPPAQAKSHAKTRRRTPPPAQPAATHTRNRGRGRAH